MSWPFLGGKNVYRKFPANGFNRKIRRCRRCARYPNRQRSKDLDKRQIKTNDSRRFEGRGTAEPVQLSIPHCRGRIIRDDNDQFFQDVRHPDRQFQFHDLAKYAGNGQF